MDVEDAKRRTYVVDRGEVALLPREHRKEVLTKHYPKYARVFAQVRGAEWVWVLWVVGGLGGMGWGERRRGGRWVCDMWV